VSDDTRFLFILMIVSYAELINQIVTVKGRFRSKLCQNVKSPIPVEIINRLLL